jgi:hypothetical protein
MSSCCTATFNSNSTFNYKCNEKRDGINRDLYVKYSISIWWSFYFSTSWAFFTNTWRFSLILFLVSAGETLGLWFTRDFLLSAWFRSVCFTSLLLYFFTSLLLYFFTSLLLYFFTSLLLYFFTSLLLTSIFNQLQHLIKSHKMQQCHQIPEWKTKKIKKN